MEESGINQIKKRINEFGSFDNYLTTLTKEQQDIILTLYQNKVAMNPHQLRRTILSNNESAPDYRTIEKQLIEFEAWGVVISQRDVVGKAKKVYAMHPKFRELINNFWRNYEEKEAP